MSQSKCVSGIIIKLFSFKFSYVNNLSHVSSTYVKLEYVPNFSSREEFRIRQVHLLFTVISVSCGPNEPDSRA